MKEIILYSGRC